MSNILDLEKYRIGNSHIFVGRAYGEFVKLGSNVNSKYDEYATVVWLIPSETYSINPSFIEPMIEDVVRKLGKEEFLKRTSFINPNSTDFQDRFVEAAERIERRMVFE